MFYYLFEYLEQQFDFIGAGLFQFITFRALLAITTSLLIATIFGKKLIKYLQKKQIGESIRDLGLYGQLEKAGTPTMGGIIIIGSVVIPVLLFAKITNVYIVLLLLTALWMSLIGFLDDYIKVFKKDKKGLRGKFKVFGQIGLGLIIGIILYFHPLIVVRNLSPDTITNTEITPYDKKLYDDKSTKTTIPFLKNNELDYEDFVPFWKNYLTPVFYILVVIFIITAVSNSANMTDGIDGLTAGTSAIIGVALAILAYVSGNLVFAEYLDIMYIPYTGEVVVFCAAFVGACIGFLWYNSYPAQVFMGDTGSLSLGAIIAVSALIIRKELLIPLLCGVFLIESISVILQVGYFKYTKKKYGEGKRIFKMAPIHHHYQKNNIHESKIAIRFWVIGILLAITTIVTLKIR